MACVGQKIVVAAADVVLVPERQTSTNTTKLNGKKPGKLKFDRGASTLFYGEGFGLVRCYNKTCTNVERPKTCFGANHSQSLHDRLRMVDEKLFCSKFCRLAV